MQDRFKFRAWIEKYKKLVDVQRFGTDGGVCEWVEHDNIYPNGEPILDEWGAVDPRQEVIKRTKAIDCLMEQCTGLKDKNDKLIYEGDIIKLTRSDGRLDVGTQLVVQWNSYAACGFGFGVIGDLTRRCAQNCEVIGNIHERKDDRTKVEMEKTE